MVYKVHANKGIFKKKSINYLYTDLKELEKEHIKPKASRKKKKDLRLEW